MAKDLKLGEEITFGAGGTINQYDPFGFDLAEPGLSWTAEEFAGFTFAVANLPAEAQPRLRVVAQPFLHPERITQQQVFIHLNGLLLGFAILSGYGTTEFPVPRTAIPGRGRCRLTFAIPTAASPQSLDLGADQRRLGIAVSAVSLIAQN